VRKKLDIIPNGIPVDVSERAKVCYVSGNHFFATIPYEITKKGDVEAISALPAAT
jgi:hypothetical protein